MVDPALVGQSFSDTVAQRRRSVNTTQHNHCRRASFSTPAKWIVDLHQVHRSISTTGNEFLFCF